METPKQSPDRKFEPATHEKILQYGNALAAALPIAITHHGEHPIVALPPGYKVEDLEKFLPTQLRRSGHLTIGSLDSFCRHVKEFKTKDTLVTFSNEGGLKAIFNYGRAGHPAGWRDDVAAYAPKRSKEFLKWKAIDGTLMRQADAARFIEDRQRDIVQPVGAEMLEIVRTLTANRKVNFVSGVRLDNGDTQFVYEETTESRAGQNGEFKVPSEILVRVPVFDEEDAVALLVRLRHQIREGVLSFQFCIDGVDYVEKTAINLLYEKAAKELGSAPLIVAG